MKDVNEARHVKLCQMTVKVDKVLVYLGYMGFTPDPKQANTHTKIKITGAELPLVRNPKQAAGSVFGYIVLI